MRKKKDLFFVINDYVHSSKITFVLMLSIVFITTFIARDPLYLPVHVDEWHHLEESRMLFQNDYYFSLNSYRVGFHILLLPLWFFSDAVKLSIFLPSIFAVLSSISLYFLVKTTFNKNAAISAIAFFATFSSSFNLLGKDFLVPLGASLSLFFLYILFWYKWMYLGEKKEWHFYLTYLLSAFIYPLSAMIFLPVIILTFIIKKKIFHIIGISILCIVGIFFMFIIYVLDGTKHSLLFYHGWGVVELKNMPTELLPIFVLLFIPLGLYYTLSNKQYFIPFVCTLLVVWIFFYRIFDVSPVVPYQRVFFIFVFLFFCLQSADTLCLENFNS